MRSGSRFSFRNRKAASVKVIGGAVGTIHAGAVVARPGSLSRAWGSGLGYRLRFVIDAHAALP
jgi:hypothetical protein